MKLSDTMGNSMEKGPALVGIELAKKGDLQPLIVRMNKLGINHKLVTQDDILYGLLV